MIRSFPSNILTAYPSKGKTAVFTSPADKQIAAYNLRAENNSGGAINVGLCKKMFNPPSQSPSYALYQYTDVGPASAEVTNALAAGTATTIFTTTNNDGFIVGAHAHFGLVGLTISTARAGLTLEYTYWNGSSYAALTLLDTPVYTATGDIFIVFQAPNDWAKGSNVTTVNQNFFTIRVRATTAGAGVVAANAFWVAKFLELYQGVANNGQIQLSFPDTKPLEFMGGESFIPYFSTANAANSAGAYYSLV